jgi:hypothetical protein
MMHLRAKQCTDGCRFVRRTDGRPERSISQIDFLSSSIPGEVVEDNDNTPDDHWPTYNDHGQLYHFLQKPKALTTPLSYSKCVKKSCPFHKVPNSIFWKPPRWVKALLHIVSSVFDGVACRLVYFDGVCHPWLILMRM